MYKLECDLVADFERAVSTCDHFSGPLDLAREFEYSCGRVDVIGKSQASDLFAFEAKLTDWRSALHQAYRATSFSHYSYVVLPAKAAARAIRHHGEFVRRGVGLCVVNDEEISIEIQASRSEPFQPWLTADALESLS